MAKKFDHPKVNNHTTLNTLGYQLVSAIIDDPLVTKVSIGVYSNLAGRLRSSSEWIVKIQLVSTGVKVVGLQRGSKIEIFFYSDNPQKLGEKIAMYVNQQKGWLLKFGEHWLE